MVGETFVGQDYLNAAVDFGTSLGGGVLSTLSNTASSAADTASQGVGYLTSLTEQDIAKEEKQKSEIKATKLNPSTTSPASISSSSLLNFENLTNGKSSSFSSPDIVKAITGVGTSVSNTMYGGSDNVMSSVQNLASKGTTTSMNVAQGVGGYIAPTVINPSSGISGKAGIINNSADNSNTQSQMLNPNLPVISDVSKIITPYESTLLESSAIATRSLSGGINSMLFDKDGKIIQYAGSGAQKLLGDIDNEISKKEKEKDELVKSAMEKGIPLESIESGINDAAEMAKDVAKTAVWDIPYTLGGYTGTVMAQGGKITRGALEDIVDKAPNMTVSKIKLPDGNTLVRWKPQETPNQAKSYPKEKEALMFDKGDSYITEGIPDNLKYQKTYKVIKGASTESEGNDVATYIPGVSNMLVKGLKYVENPKPGESEADKSSRLSTNNIFDPTSIVGSDKITNKMNNKTDSSYITSKYVYPQQVSDEKIKEKRKLAKGQVFRQKASSMPKIILVNALRKQIGNVTARVNNNTIMNIRRKRPKQIAKKVTKEVSFIQRTPDVKFKVDTAMKSMSGVSDNIESFITMNSSNSMLVDKPNFNFNMDNILVKPQINIGLVKRTKKSKK